MNYIPQIAKMFGVEIGEKFEVILKGTRDQNKGLFYFENDTIRSGFPENNKEPNDNHRFDWILLALIFGDAKIKKLPWKPKDGDMYYIPYINGGEVKADCKTWNNGNSVDEARYDAGLVCRTKEEALKKAEKMLEVLKDEH